MIQKEATKTAALMPGTVILNPSLNVLEPKEAFFAPTAPTVILSPSFVLPQTQTNIVRRTPRILKVRSKNDNYLDLDQTQNTQATAAQVE